MYGAHLFDEAFSLSAQFDLGPLSLACIPAWARPSRAGLRLEPHLTKLARANFIGRDRSPEAESTFPTDVGFRIAELRGGRDPIRVAPGPNSN